MGNLFSRWSLAKARKTKVGPITCKVIPRRSYYSKVSFANTTSAGSENRKAPDEKIHKNEKGRGAPMEAWSSDSIFTSGQLKQIESSVDDQVVAIRIQPNGNSVIDEQYTFRRVRFPVEEEALPIPGSVQLEVKRQKLSMEELLRQQQISNAIEDAFQKYLFPNDDGEQHHFHLVQSENKSQVDFADVVLKVNATDDKKSNLNAAVSSENNTNNTVNKDITSKLDPIKSKAIILEVLSEWVKLIENEEHRHRRRK